MKKDLPNVYANPIDKNFDNVQEFFYGSSVPLMRNNNVEDVLVKINKIFNSRHHVYKSKVRVVLENEVLEVEIIGKANGNLLTLDGKKIKIVDIKDIERI